MKKSLPENAKIAKEAKECVQECVSEFISFITSEYPFDLMLQYRLFQSISRSLTYLFSLLHSQWSLLTRKEKNHQWRRYPVGYAIIRIWKLCWDTQDLSSKIPRGTIGMENDLGTTWVFKQCYLSVSRLPSWSERLLPEKRKMKNKAHKLINSSNCLCSNKHNSPKVLNNNLHQPNLPQAWLDHTITVNQLRDIRTVWFLHAFYFTVAQQYLDQSKNWAYILSLLSLYQYKYSPTIYDLKLK